METATNKMLIFCQDKFPMLPKLQKVNFCNFSAELKNVNTETMAPAKLLNINPAINMVMVSRKNLDIKSTNSNTEKLPKQEAKMIP